MTARRTLLVAAALVAAALPATGQAEAAPPAPPVLTSVTATHVGDVDRVVFRYTGGVPDTVFTDWVDTLHADGSGRPVRVAGAKVLAVSMNGAVAHDDEGSTVERRTTFALPNVLTAVQAGDFEGSVLYGVGVQKQTTHRVRVLSDRVVVEVGAAFPTATRKVFFVDQDAHVRSVDRRLPAGAPAAAALHALFAGPLAAERAAGLRLVRSRAWGFTGLQVAGGIARLRLTRACGSGGATVTVADEIVATLKQFPTVDWVKISAPGGGTEQPDGPVDSIPVCLEP